MGPFFKEVFRKSPNINGLFKFADFTLKLYRGKGQGAQTVIANGVPEEEAKFGGPFPHVTGDEKFLQVYFVGAAEAMQHREKMAPSVSKGVIQRV